MNLQRLNEIYSNQYPIEKSDIDNLKQLTEDYPYFNKPYEILARYYFETKHYKFEDMLRQAAMRVKDRKELYEFIHGKQEDTVVLTPLETSVSNEQMLVDRLPETQ